MRNTIEVPLATFVFQENVVDPRGALRTKEPPPGMTPYKYKNELKFRPDERQTNNDSDRLNCIGITREGIRPTLVLIYTKNDI